MEYSLEYSLQRFKGLEVVIKLVAIGSSMTFTNTAKPLLYYALFTLLYLLERANPAV